MAVRSRKSMSDSADAGTKSAGLAKQTKAAGLAKPTKTAGLAKPTKTAGLAKPTKTRSGLLRIRVHYDVGVGNRITVRGDTAPYCWDQGIDAKNTADDIWEFQVARIPAGKRFEFKPLINDTLYAAGDNYVGTGRKTLDIFPVFARG